MRLAYLTHIEPADLRKGREVKFFIREIQKEKDKNQLNNKNLYQLAGIIFIITSFTPLIPSGSFFTTYGATIFWINFAIVESFNN